MCCIGVKFYFFGGYVETFVVFDKYLGILCFIEWVIVFTCIFCFVIDLKMCQFIFYIIHVSEYSTSSLRCVYFFKWDGFEILSCGRVFLLLEFLYKYLREDKQLLLVFLLWDHNSLDRFCKII